MEQFPLLDIVIGLLLIYTFLSLLSSELTEWAITVLQWRRRSLKRAMMILLGEPLELGKDPKTFKDTIAGRLYSSSSMTAIAERFDQRRVTLSPRSAPLFAEALIDVLRNLPHKTNRENRPVVAETPVTNLLSIVESSPEVSPQLKANLRRLINRARMVEPDPQQQMVQLNQEIALWFNQAMRDMFRVYKHDLKTISFLVSLTLVVAINADSLYIIRRISENTATRAIVIQHVTQIQSCQKNLSSPSCVERVSTLMESSTIPIGWQRSNRQKQFSQISGGSFLRAIGGWLLTGIAVSMGARFWLQLLNRFVQIGGGEFLKRDSTHHSARATTKSRKYKSSYNLR
jgi:hypothetical protein